MRLLDGDAAVGQLIACAESDRSGGVLLTVLSKGSIGAFRVGGLHHELA